VEAAASRLDAALAAIDAANADDPATLAHAELVSRWVQQLDADATEAQLLAARACHLRRFTLPRSTYPDGRAGYLRWRAEAKKRHAAEVAAILADAGYDPPTVERVQGIIRKEGLGRDPQVQVHEDALCLTFLETQLDETTAATGDEKMVDVLVKTLAKMSEQAIGAAAALPLSESGAALLAEAVARRRSDPHGTKGTGG
jgi:Domain of unknown function (DUF4202)